MKVLITGICGFAGSTLAGELTKHRAGMGIVGLDNLSRPGSELNRQVLKQQGVRLFHGDIRNPSDLESLPAVDWIIDAAANPSVLAGVSGQTSSRQLIEHNLIGTVNLLEHCKRARCGFLMLSTSRVYSLQRLAGLKMESKAGAFEPKFKEIVEAGLTAAGVTEDFSTETPLSLYGASKLASEIMVSEYATAFDFPAYVNRCGVLAGAGQFGKADQGIFSFWIHSYCHKKPLKYIGFGGTGMQVRDCLHPRDLVSLLLKQMDSSGKNNGVVNVSGGRNHGISLLQLTHWCARRFGLHDVKSEDVNRPYDVPWLILNSERAGKIWDWRPVTSLEEILAEIALHAERNPQWLELSTEK
ncbi:MAG TPA: NAD-dependent epimerase/dehydratase family protein [Verrucomicrobiae bacterium]|nr:NAD-dependent epimerase/dehydratase family protein [Verrucomicrobiae bacterium]